MSTKRLVTIALLTASALIIHIVEAQIPVIIAIPGIKLGLANIITLAAVYSLGNRDALFILVARVILGSIFSGQVTTFFYSIVGGLICWALTCLGKRLLAEDKIWAVSIFAAIGHNMGQTAVAAVMLGTLGVLWYLPYLTLAAIITGCFTGFAAKFLVSQLKKIDLSK